jgi:hypothetical protein
MARPKGSRNNPKKIQYKKGYTPEDALKIVQDAKASLKGEEITPIDNISVKKIVDKLNARSSTKLLRKFIPYGVNTDFTLTKHTPQI